MRFLKRAHVWDSCAAKTESEPILCPKIGGMLGEAINCGTGQRPVGRGHEGARRCRRRVDGFGAAVCRVARVVAWYSCSRSAAASERATQQPLAFHDHGMLRIASRHAFAAVACLAAARLRNRFMSVYPGRSHIVVGEKIFACVTTPPPQSQAASTLVAKKVVPLTARTFRLRHAGI